MRGSLVQEQVVQERSQGNVNIGTMYGKKTRKNKVLIWVIYNGKRVMNQG